MIGKCKAIAHGSNALEYIFREGKLGKTLLFHNLCGTTPKEIYEEMKMVSDYNTRCRNKFLRIEIGIAPQDEKRLSLASVRNLASNFAIRMGLANHQWVAVTHKDTDNMHIHIIANRISLYGNVYDTTFVSNKAARVAEELSRKYGMTIAKEVKTERTHKKIKASPTREQTKQQVQKICYALLDRYKGTGITGHSMFLYDLSKSGVTIERLKNKQGKICLLYTSKLFYACAGQAKQFFYIMLFACLCLSSGIKNTYRAFLYDDIDWNDIPAPHSLVYVLFVFVRNVPKSIVKEINLWNGNSTIGKMAKIYSVCKKAFGGIYPKKNFRRTFWWNTIA